MLHFACEAVPVDENGLEMYKITKGRLRQVRKLSYKLVINLLSNCHKLVEIEKLFRNNLYNINLLERQRKMQREVQGFKCIQNSEQLLNRTFLLRRIE